MAKISTTIILSLDELSNTVRLQREVIIELVDLQLMQPQGETEQDWIFDELCLKRARLAANLFHDLEINTPGIALAIELLEQIEALENKIDLLEKLNR